MPNFDMMARAHRKPISIDFEFWYNYKFLNEILHQRVLNGWHMNSISSWKASIGPLAPWVKSKSVYQPFSTFLAWSVPRDRGVRGAARGLERELRASGRHRKKKRNGKTASGSTKNRRTGKKKTTIQHGPLHDACHTHLSMSNLAVVDGKKRWHFKVQTYQSSRSKKY